MTINADSNPFAEAQADLDRRRDPNYDLRQKIDAERQARARLEAERTADRERRELEEQLAAEQLETKNAEAIAAAEAEHGPVGKSLEVVHTSSGVVIVKRPHSALFRRFQDSGKQTTAEYEKLINPCVVYPTLPELVRWTEIEPATTLRVANAVCTLAGIRSSEVAGK